MCLAILASYGLLFAVPVMHDDHHPFNPTLCYCHHRCYAGGSTTICRAPLATSPGDNSRSDGNVLIECLPVVFPPDLVTGSGGWLKNEFRYRSDG